MKSLFTIVVLLLLAISAVPQKAYAHVFYTDTTGTYGIIMHAVPDDDPIAGEMTDFYIEVKDPSITGSDYAYRFNIVNENNMQTTVLVQKRGERSLHASYIFPEQGTYLLELIAYPITDDRRLDESRENIVFHYNQRVSRGTIGSPLDSPRFVWAEFGMLAAGCGIVVLGIIVVNRSERIARFTKWK